MPRIFWDATTHTFAESKLSTDQMPLRSGNLLIFQAPSLLPESVIAP